MDEDDEEDGDESPFHQSDDADQSLLETTDASVVPDLSILKTESVSPVKRVENEMPAADKTPEIVDQDESVVMPKAEEPNASLSESWM